MSSYLYCHFKKDNDLPFYIGIGRTTNRAFQNKSRSDWHKNVVASHGIRPEIIAELTDWETAQWWEIKWIKALKDTGYILVNQTPGGDGGPTWIGRRHSDETKLKMSLAAKGNKGNLGRIFSEEHKNKLSLSQIGNKKALGRKDSEETKILKSKSHKGKKHALGHKWTDEQKSKNILARIGQKRTEEQRQRMKDAWIVRRSKIKGDNQ